MRFIPVVLLFQFFHVYCFGQYDFNDYKTMESSGPIPKDFCVPTYEKINFRLDSTDVHIRNSIEQVRFLENTMYYVDDILHSGYVVFGDPISNRINQIGQLILKDNPELFNHLRFYTLKSDATNAFCTDEGIIFTTTGLVSQLNNDAELAYVLCHEICHFVEKHVVNTFNWSKKIKGTNWVSQLSQYSRDNELDADSLAVDLFKNAGFKIDAIESMFDVLLYSHLPFDEIPVDQSYFKDSIFKFPQSFILDRAKPIISRENEDDSKSTHPNVSKRKNAVKLKIDSMPSNWGDRLYITTESDFLTLRKIARFESLRIQVINAEFAKALYSIFILEKEDQNSIFLTRMKAQSWLGIAQYCRTLRKHDIALPKEEYEGESSLIHHFINTQNESSLIAYALRVVHNIYKANKNDFEISLIYNELIKEFAESPSIEFKDFFTISYADYLSSKAGLSQETPDSAAKKTESSEKENNQEGKQLKTNAKITKSRYVKVTSNKKSDSWNFEDSTDLYLFGLWDVLIDTHFLAIYNSTVETLKMQKKQDEELAALKKGKRRKWERKHINDKYHLGLNKLIILEPTILSLSKVGVDDVRSEYLENDFINAYKIAAEEAKVSTDILSKSLMKDQSVDDFNDRNLLITQLGQYWENEEIRRFPVDFSRTMEISEKRGSSKVMLSWVVNLYEVRLNHKLITSSFGLFFSGPLFLSAYIPIKLIKGSRTESYIMILDIATGQLLLEDERTYYSATSKHNLIGHFYVLFKNLQQSKEKIQ